MNVQKSVQAWREALDEAHSGPLRRIARELGHELPRRRESILREFCAAASRPSEPASDYVRGYREGLLELLQAYQAALAARLEDEQAEQMARREGWRRILLLLAEAPTRPSAISDQLDWDPGQVSRSLRDLRAVGLVEVWKTDGADGRSRPHRLTPRGERVIRALSEERDPAASEDETTAPLPLPEAAELEAEEDLAAALAAAEEPASTGTESDIRALVDAPGGELVREGVPDASQPPAESWLAVARALLRALYRPEVARALQAHSVSAEREQAPPALGRRGAPTPEPSIATRAPQRGRLQDAKEVADQRLLRELDPPP